MQTFFEWLQVIEQRQELVSQAVLDSYEVGFRQALKQLLGKVKDPVLRAKFERMLDCPIKDARGRCQSFTDFIVSVLIRHQIHRVADVEDALSYVYQTMMLDRKINGAPKATVFGSFNFDRPFNSEGNPLEARFKTAVANAVQNIASGRIRRLLHTPSSTVSAENIPSRPDRDQAFGELTKDITTLLARKENETNLPLVGMFNAMVSGETTANLRRLFGARAATVGRQIVIQTIKDFAHQTGNVALTQLFKKLDQPNVPTAQLPKAQPATASPKDRDFASILSVVDKLGRPCGTADLGRFRRRWLEYPPRDDGVHRNRLEEVLYMMLKDGVLKAVQTARGAVAYVPGPNAEAYRRTAAA